MTNKETYKRLTSKKEDRYWEQEEFWQSAEEPSYEQIEELYSRLAELEDKIENGTLIDTKVRIGQRVFRRGFFKGEVDEYLVSNIILENGKLEVHLKHDFDEHKTCYSATVLDIEKIGKTVFLTRAETEAKLKELQEKQQ